MAFEPAPDDAAPLLIAAAATTAEVETVWQLASRAISLKQGSTNAIGFSVSHHGEFVASWSLGDSTDRVPLTEHGRFRVASMSKLLTGFATLVLVDSGQLQLDQPFLQQFASPWSAGDERWERVTVRHLLQHTSGLTSMRGVFFRMHAQDWQQATRIAIEARPAYEPGTHFDYSNANFVLLGALIEQITGVTYEEAVHQLVLDPLGIVSPAMVGTHDQPAGDAPHTVDAGRNYLEVLGPAGAWTMTPTDAARLTAVLDPAAAANILAPDTVAAMRAWSGIDTDEPDFQYGLGVMLFGNDIGHTGTIEGVRSFVLSLPNGYGLTVLAASERVNDGTALIKYFRDQLDALATLP